jgi:polar amino acid transport system ATP-binding protein
MLNITNLSKEFAGKKILENISLNVKAHEIVGLAGGSGTGKSTLLRIIQGLDSLTAGKIAVNGRVGFMFQDFQLFPHLNVFENIIYAPKINKVTFNFTERAEELLEKLGLSEYRSIMPKNLSGGQKQRVALARALIMKPDLLLCDEPTSGLDVATITEVVELLREISATGVTMIIASHDLDFLTKIATRVIVLKKAQVKFDQEIQNLENPIEQLKKLY